MFRDYPLVVFVVSFAVQCAAAYATAFLRRRGAPLSKVAHSDFAVLLPGSLTLLALIIGFSFSMAVGRYDQRKDYEEAEANAIGTEYLRADLLPPADAGRVQGLLATYLDQRILFYRAREEDALERIQAQTSSLQKALWSAVAAPAVAQPTATAALVAAGMNDVINSESYTQASWWNRIPAAAWAVMILVAVGSNLLLGANEKRAKESTLLILPLIVSIPLFLVADIDSPRSGLIPVSPDNLTALSQTLKHS